MDDVIGVHRHATVDATIAAEAGVAVQTRYLSFGSKTAILGSAFDTAIAGDDEPVPIMQREWMQKLRQNPQGLTSFVDNTGAVIERASALYEVIRAAAADPEVAELLAELFPAAGARTGRRPDP